MNKIVFVNHAGVIEFKQVIPANNTLDYIPAAIYEPFVDHEKGIVGLKYLMPKFEQSSTVRYGDITLYKQQILEAVNKRTDTSTGVMVLGDPGTGKTLLAEDLSNHLNTKGYPTLYIRRHFPVALIHELVSRMGRCMVFFDEFGKNYKGMSAEHNPHLRQSQNVEVNMGEQAELLLLFSDASLKGVLFYISSNETDQVGTMGLQNRPSRFLFRINSNRMEMSSYLDMISQHPMSKEMRHFLFTNVFTTNLMAKNPEYSSDSLRFVLNMVKEDTTPSELMQQIAIYNLPRHTYNCIELLVECGDNKPDDYQFELGPVEDDIVQLVCKHKAGTFETQVLEINLNLIEIIKNNIEHYCHTTEHNGHPYFLTRIKTDMFGTRIWVTAKIYQAFRKVNYAENAHLVLNVAPGLQEGQVPEPAEEGSNGLLPMRPPTAPWPKIQNSGISGGHYPAWAPNPQEHSRLGGNAPATVFPPSTK